MKRPSASFLPSALQQVQLYVQPYTGPTVIWSLYLTGAAICLLRAVGLWLLGPPVPGGKQKSTKRADLGVDVDGGGDQAGAERNGQARKKEAAVKAQRMAESTTEGLQNVKKK